MVSGNGQIAIKLIIKANLHFASVILKKVGGFNPINSQ